MILIIVTFPPSLSWIARESSMERSAHIMGVKCDIDIRGGTHEKEWKAFRLHYKCTAALREGAFEYAVCQSRDHSLHRKCRIKERLPGPQLVPRRHLDNRKRCDDGVKGNDVEKINEQE